MKKYIGLFLLIFISCGKTTSTINISSEELKKYIDNPEAITQDANIKEFEKASKDKYYFQVDNIARNSIFEKMGFQNGDIVQKVNGKNPLYLFRCIWGEGDAKIEILIKRNKNRIIQNCFITGYDEIGKDNVTLDDLLKSASEVIKESNDIEKEEKP